MKHTDPNSSLRLLPAALPAETRSSYSPRWLLSANRWTRRTLTCSNKRGTLQHQQDRWDAKCVQDLTRVSSWWGYNLLQSTELIPSSTRAAPINPGCWPAPERSWTVFTQEETHRCRHVNTSNIYLDTNILSTFILNKVSDAGLSLITIFLHCGNNYSTR